MNHLKERFNITYFIAVVTVIFSLFFISVSLVSAVPAAPSPTCEIEADVLGAKKTKKITLPINAPSQEIEYYSVNLKILKVSTFQDEGPATCDNLYPVNSEKETILFPNEYNKNPVMEGQRIKGQFHFGGDERFGGIFLSNISIISQPPKPAKTIITGTVIGGGDTTPEGLFDAPRKFVYQVKQDDGSIVKVTYTAYPSSPAGDREMKKIHLSFYAGTVKVGDQLKARGSFDKTTQTLTVADEGDYIETSPGQKPPSILKTSEVSEKLLQQKYVDDVSSISLQPNQQAYTVQGTKKGKLFFFIPVRFNIRLEVDATTGTVKEIKKPWWAFLVR